MIEVEAFPTTSGPIDLRVAKGEVVLLRGSNGSGKTSLLRAIAGLDAPVRPRAVRVLGQDPRALAGREIRTTLAFSPQEPSGALAGLTVAGEFRLRMLSVAEESRALASREVARLSSGEARRTTLALARAAAPPVLLLDEPAEWLDEEGRARLRAIVETARARGAVLAADHGDAIAGLATREVRLDGPGGREPEALPAPGGAPVLECDAHEAALDGRALAMPALALPAGAHALVGPNGCGKTTLLRSLAGLMGAPRARTLGRPARAGVDLRYAPADPRALFTRDRVEDELASADARVASLLVPQALRERHPLALSAGEAQRVSLAKALGRPARAYLLDEPEAHLDADGRAALAAALALRIREGACALAATHDEALAAACASRVRMGART